MQLRLGASLNAQVELLAVRDDLLNDRLYLVHLDRIDHVVLAFVLILLGSLLETAPGLLDTIVQNVGKTQQYRSLHVTKCQLIHHLTDIYLCGVLARRHIDITLFVDTEVAGTPAVDVVELTRVFNRPFLHSLILVYGDDRAYRDSSALIRSTLTFILS